MTTPDLAAALRDALIAGERQASQQIASLRAQLAAYPGVQRALEQLTMDEVTVLVDAVRAMEIARWAQERPRLQWIEDHRKDTP